MLIEASCHQFHRPFLDVMSTMGAAEPQRVGHLLRAALREEFLSAEAELADELEDFLIRIVELDAEKGARLR